MDMMMLMTMVQIMVLYVIYDDVVDVAGATAHVAPATQLMPCLLLLLLFPLLFQSLAINASALEVPIVFASLFHEGLIILA